MKEKVPPSATPFRLPLPRRVKYYETRVCDTSFCFPQYFQQFFKHDFSETHVRTAKPFRYRSCLVCDTMIRELIVLDVPPQVSAFISGFISLFMLPRNSEKNVQGC